MQAPRGQQMQLRWIPARFTVVGLLLASALGGCATVPNGSGDDARRDPLEPFNRRVFAVNQSLDRAVIKPVAKAYRDALPETVRDRIRAFVDNLGEPLTFANDLLQGRGEAAGITGRRFLINSTIGLAGLFDRATELGEVRQSGDFGQTLYAWGIADGPYLMLPFFGPSTVRDAFGFGVDTYASPMGHIGSDATRTKSGVTVGVVGGVDLRSRNIETLDAIEAASLDYYVYLRSVWRQHREATLREAREGALPPDLDLTDPDAPPAPTVK
ncbi:MAG: VacJ family lipoprotein [Burkholderiaceae bacterium]